MKQRDLVRHLTKFGCRLHREGGRHSVYINQATSQTSSVPRHDEINNFLAKKICRDLGVEPPTKR